MFFIKRIYLFFIGLSIPGLLAQEDLAVIGVVSPIKDINTMITTESNIMAISLDNRSSPATPPLSSPTSTPTAAAPPSTSSTPSSTTLSPTSPTTPSTTPPTTLPTLPLTTPSNTPPTTPPATAPTTPPSAPLTTPPTIPSTTRSTSSTSFVLNDLSSSSAVSSNRTGIVDDTSLPLWELIYPEQKSTFTGDVNKPFTDKSVPTTPKSGESQKKQLEKQSFGKLFKVDDVTNCEKHFGECLRQVLTKILPKLKISNDATAYLTPIDPFYVNRTSFQYNGEPLNGYITVGYAFVHGLTSMKFGKVLFKRGPKNTFKLRLSTSVPTLLARGSYKADLKVNSVTVRPKGQFNITLHSVAVEQLAEGEIYVRDGHTFIRLTTMNATAAVKDAKLNATGLIQDARLNEIILNVTNQYWREILNILLPDTRDNWTPVIRNALNEVLAVVPFDFLMKN